MQERRYPFIKPTATNEGFASLKGNTLPVKNVIMALITPEYLYANDLA